MHRACLATAAALVGLSTIAPGPAVALPPWLDEIPASAGAALRSGHSARISDHHSAAGAATLQLASSAFGFYLGEERRYVLGPPEALGAGESATWLIRLERLRDNGEAVFTLGHQRQGPEYATGTPAYGEELSATMEGELTVNPYGFPGVLSVAVRRQFYGRISDEYHVHYRFDGRSFLKEVQTFDKQWEFAIPITSHEHLDKSVPIGLYLFLPDAFHCAGYRPATTRMAPLRQPKLSAGGGLSPATVPRVDRYAIDCEPDTDLGFLNPGLLSLSWATVLEHDGDRDFLFFTPTGADLFPGPKTSFMAGGSGVSGSTGGRSGSIEKARDTSRYYARSRIRLREEATIRIRGRSFDTRVAEINHLAGRVYFDDGKVIRIDIDPRMASSAIAPQRGTGAIYNFDPGALKERWIRLMLPSEY
jgi:hypothetical protein